MRRRIAGGALVVMLGALAVSAGLAIDHYGTQIDKQRADTADVRAEIGALPEKPRQDTSLQQRLSTLLVGADEQAGSLVGVQNGYKQLEHDADRAESPEDGTPSEEDEAVADHRRVVAEHIDKSDYLVEGEDAYQWTTSAFFDPVTELDPRWPWYVRYDGEDIAEPQSWSWRLESVTPQLETTPAPGTIGAAEVVFTARDADTDEVLAFAEAVYTGHRDEAGEIAGTFSDTEVTTTVAGAQQDAPGGDEAAEVIEALRPDGEVDQDPARTDEMDETDTEDAR